MEDRTYKTPLGRIIHQMMKRKEHENATNWVRQNQLEVAKAFWNSVSKKSWQFWKEDKSSGDYVFKKTIENLESKQKKTLKDSSVNIS